MRRTCRPYPRQPLYWFLTVPMIVMYVAVAVLLWTVGTGLFVLYCALFAVVALCQSVACVHWECPYVGRFAPCMGGFCLPSSRIALALGSLGRSRRVYAAAVTVASLAVVGIVAVPVHALYRRSPVSLLAYVAALIVYAVAFLWLICPACETRDACPGGRAATRMKGSAGNARPTQNKEAP